MDAQSALYAKLGRPQCQTGNSNRVRQLLKQQAQTQMSSRSRAFFDLIRGPNKREWIDNFLLEKLPYHPRWYRTGTRFDAVLSRPLDFGKTVIRPEDLLPDSGCTFCEQRCRARMSFRHEHRKPKRKSSGRLFRLWVARHRCRSGTAPNCRRTQASAE